MTDRLKFYGSHFHLPTKKVFTLGKCENCDGEVQEPNAVTVTNLKDVDKSELTEYKETVLPPEMYWNDALECATCEDCDRGEEPTW
jgi:hypothetical protein